MKKGPSGVTQLHEQICQLSSELEIETAPIPKTEASPISWNQGHDSLNENQKQHAWFTNGSAKYIGQDRYWKAISYNPQTQVILETTGKGKSSQFVELQAVYQATMYEKEKKMSHFYRFLGVANGLHP